ncbi:PFL_4669 family integrating conjugative element protein [Actinobacillus delphinicola]|uniref:Integrating conjugative element protein, PFL_4669 family n=1 Tax=Actinobacillus delphinicola TaxID=51161 RepID=A0A448TTN7_9PAST|nr:TIGR03761 family integrating conjugative element protein [Actinobacillus delphinicola]VEJ09367.1 integrating conjugative element protein, PFL_4669 family [Actinobacillus delphinicola]
MPSSNQIDTIQIGALQSEMIFTVHTRYTINVWLGRIAKHQITIPKAMGILTQVQRDASEDDPFADLFLLNFEKLILDSTDKMKTLIDALANILVDNLPEGIDISQCINVQPATFPIYLNSPLGYKLIYIVSDFDLLAKTALTSRHIGILTHSEMKEWISSGSQLLRQLLGMVKNYRHTGLTRQDVLDNNTRYQEVMKNFNLEALPEGVLDRSLRSGFAPLINKKASLTNVETQKIDNE